MMTKKKLLILGTSTATREIIDYAKEKQIYTVVSDDREPEISFAKKWADEYWMINTSETETLAKKCEEAHIDGVICGLSEFNIEMMNPLDRTSWTSLLYNRRHMALLQGQGRFQEGLP